MENNPYNPISNQIQKLENARRSNLFRFEIENEKHIIEDEYFLNTYYDFEEKFSVTVKLLGEKNFKRLLLLFLKTNPKQSAKSNKYGQNFPQFLGSMAELQNFYFIKYIAMLDWFWFLKESPKNTITLPKGTLKSWGILARDEDSIQIELDEYETETLSIMKKGKEFKIIAK